MRERDIERTGVGYREGEGDGGEGQERAREVRGGRREMRDAKGDREEGWG